MECTWYNGLMGTIEITGTGIVADNLELILDNGMFQKLPVTKDLDSGLAKDISTWFNDVFNPWFSSLSRSLTVGNQLQELTATTYTEKINSVIAALFVARSFYAKVADAEFITSLKNVALYKASICEEVARSVAFAFEEALMQYGSEIQGKSVETTGASTYEGTTPEKFIWNGNVIVNHVKYEKVKIMGDPNMNQNQVSNCSGSKQYLPWVFCAAFGLIAWASAAKETNQKQQRSTNK